MQITFYHWGCQCPIIAEMLELFQCSAMDDVTCIDITRQEKLAYEKQLYYPFLTIFNQQLYWYGPVTAAVLEGIRNGTITKEEPFIIEQSHEEKRGSLLPLTSDTLPLTSQGCTMCADCGQIKRKSDFLASCGLTTFGLVHQLQGHIVGGAEWMPSNQVPYPIPKDAHTAFLTCVYHSSEEADYKAWPLQCLEKELCKAYRRIIVICDEKSTFPNGPKNWFEKHGYRDLGLIQVLDGYARLHLLEKKLSE